MKKKKISPDENEMAFDVISKTLAQTEPRQIDPAVSAAARALSKLGAHLGGKARAAKLSSRQRKSIARKGAVAMWKKKRQDSKGQLKNH